jgi:hypothetical protein
MLYAKRTLWCRLVCIIMLVAAAARAGARPAGLLSLALRSGRSAARLCLLADYGLQVPRLLLQHREAFASVYHVMT